MGVTEFQQNHERVYANTNRKNNKEKCRIQMRQAKKLCYCYD